MRSKLKLVHGAGINDADYPVTINSNIGGRYRQIWVCPFYSVWKNVLARCHSAKTQARQPAYIGCSVDQEWLSFSEFRKWMLSQEWEGKEIDKDILSPGNKKYSPDYCVFVPAILNTFLLDRYSDRGQWPLGVSWHKASGKYQAKCNDPFAGNQGYLGLFTCPGAAHEAWRQRKHELACQYADQQTDPRIAQALRARYLKGEKA